MLTRALRMGCKEAEQSGWRDHVWRRKEAGGMCVAVISFKSFAPTELEEEAQAM